MTFELRTVAGIPRPTDRASFGRLSIVRKNTLYALWQMDPSVKFCIRVTDSRLNAWLPLLGATPDSDDANVASLDIFRLEYLFLPAFCLAPALFDTDAGDAFVVPGRLHGALSRWLMPGLISRSARLSLFRMALALQFFLQESRSPSPSWRPSWFLQRMTSSMSKSPMMMMSTFSGRP